MMNAESKCPGLDGSREVPDTMTPAEARRRQRSLSRQLKRMYESVVEEPVPDTFTKLLQEIDERHDGTQKRD